MHQSWQPDTSRDAFAQHCAAFSGAQQVFFTSVVSSFIALSFGVRGGTLRARRAG
jgi:hypothetical protein